MNKNLRAPILATLGIASLAVAIPLSIANAQDQQPRPERLQRQGAPDQFQGRPGQGGFGQGEPGGPGMMMRGGMGGSPVMIDDQQNLYVLAGNRLFKVSKANLDVVAEGMLPMGPQPGGPGGFEPGGPPPVEGQPGIRQQRRGGGEDLRLPGDPLPPTE